MSGQADIAQDSMVQEVTITPGELTLGRGEDNSVTFANTSVSAHHAKITTLFNATYIEDLGSTNGTIINGKKIIKHTLHDGDTVFLGEQPIKIVKPNLMSVV